MKDEFTGRNFYAGPATSVALGVFDGVHKGHRKILDTVVESGFESWVFTFKGNTLPGKKANIPMITEPEIKYSIMKQCGIEHCYAVDFDEIKDLSGEEFVEKYLLDMFHCEMAVVGSDFRFGKDASCSAQDLQRICLENGITSYIVDKVCDESGAISSTRIRDALLKGDVIEAEKLLGYPFCIYDEIKPGNRIGSDFGVPTINQKFDEGYIIPKYGVYASAVLVDGKLWPAVTNIGVKPTVSAENIPGVETNIIGFSKDMYGKQVPVLLLDFIRDEKEFESPEILFEQIKEDRAKAGDISVKWINESGKEAVNILGV